MLKKGKLSIKKIGSKMKWNNMAKKNKYLGKAFCPFCGIKIDVFEHSLAANCTHMWGSISKHSGVMNAIRKLRSK